MTTEWISVNKLLPEENKMVVMGHIRDQWSLAGSWDGNNWYNQFLEKEGPCYPTHWQPLPLPPIEPSGNTEPDPDPKKWLPGTKDGVIM